MELMFSKKGIVYLSKTHVSIYYKDINIPLRVDFDKDILDNPSEASKEWLKTQLKTIENKVKLNKLKAILILSKDIVFDKILEDDTQDKDKRELEINEFLAGLPIGVDLVEGKEFIKGGNVLVTATNKNLYLTLIEVLNPLNIEINYVLPEIVFNRVDFTKKFLEEIFREKVLLNFGNFLEEDENANKLTWGKIRKSLLSLVLIGGILGVIIYLGVTLKSNIHIDFTKYLDGNTNTKAKDTSSSSNSEDLVGNGKEESVEKDAPKEDITVSVLNGTGTPGFASSIGTLIKNIGYTEVTTLNADSFDYVDTIIEVNDKTSDTRINEIKDALKGTLKSFEVRRTSGLGNKILITTGKTVN